ncbi:uncharacterized protein ACNS7B_023835 [Menidia menidia]
MVILSVYSVNRLSLSGVLLLGLAACFPLQKSPTGGPDYGSFGPGSLYGSGSSGSGSLYGSGSSGSGSLYGGGGGSSGSGSLYGSGSSGSGSLYGSGSSGSGSWGEQDADMARFFAGLLSFRVDRPVPVFPWTSDQVPLGTVAKRPTFPSSHLVTSRSGYQRARDSLSHAKYSDDISDHIPLDGPGSKGQKVF